MGLDQVARNERGPVGDDFTHRRTAFAVARPRRRAAQYERDQLARETVGGIPVVPPRADTHLHLRRLGAGAGDGTRRRVVPNKTQYQGIAAGPGWLNST